MGEFSIGISFASVKVKLLENPFYDLCKITYDLTQQGTEKIVGKTLQPCYSFGYTSASELNVFFLLTEPGGFVMNSDKIQTRTESGKFQCGTAKKIIE